MEDVPERQNESAIRQPIGARLTHEVLGSFARELRRRRPSLSPAARNHASNLIEQLDGIKTPADLARMRPFIARSMKLLQEAGR